MYICRDCGKQFDEPERTYDDPSPAGVSLASGYYVYEECPCCGSEDIEEAHQCQICREWTIEDSTICHSCREQITDEVREIQDSWKLPDSDFRRIIDDIMEWNW